MAFSFLFKDFGYEHFEGFLEDHRLLVWVAQTSRASWLDWPLQCECFAIVRDYVAWGQHLVDVAALQHFWAGTSPLPPEICDSHCDDSDLEMLYLAYLDRLDLESAYLDRLDLESDYVSSPDLEEERAIGDRLALEANLDFCAGYEENALEHALDLSCVF